MFQYRLSEDCKASQNYFVILTVCEEAFIFRLCYYGNAVVSPFFKQPL